VARELEHVAAGFESPAHEQGAGELLDEERRSFRGVEHDPHEGRRGRPADHGGEQLGDVVRLQRSQ
jgi:hypothetical protein